MIASMLTVAEHASGNADDDCYRFPTSARVLDFVSAFAFRASDEVSLDGLRALSLKVKVL